MAEKTKNRYKYFAVIQDPAKPPFRETVVFINRLGRTDPQTGFVEPPICKGIEPNANGMYVIDTEASFAKEKLAALGRVVAKGVLPIIGPFDSHEDAIIAERKKRPMTKDEENAALKQRIAELEARANSRGDAIRTPA
ncbi:MAG: hypothetical protein WC451_05215 [Patescibacteria group bacterium]